MTVHKLPPSCRITPKLMTPDNWPETLAKWEAQSVRARKWRNRLAWGVLALTVALVASAIWLASGP